MSDNQKHEQRHFAINGIKNTGFYYTKSLVTVNTNFLSFIVCN